jgi:hypothetical protein
MMLSESVRNAEQSSLVRFGGGCDRLKTVSDRMKDQAARLVDPRGCIEGTRSICGISLHKK